MGRHTTTARKKPAKPLNFVGDPNKFNITAPGTKRGGDDRATDRTSTETVKTDRSDRLIRQLMEEAKMGREEATAAVDSVINGELGDLKGSKKSSDAREDAAVDRLHEFLTDEEMAAINPADYVGDYASEGANAKVDAASRGAQYGALDKLKGWTDQKLTPEEKFMMESARQTQEHDMRSARESATRDMASRGVRSGSAQMASVLGGAQQTSQNRLLGDLGAQANAQKRALRATESYGTLATDISDQSFKESESRGAAADQASEFNNTLKNTYDAERQRFELDQQEKRFGRQESVTDRRVNQANNSFNRQAGITEGAFRGSGQKVNALTGGNGDMMEAIKIALGQEEADKAAAALKPDESFHLFKPNTWF